MFTVNTGHCVAAYFGYLEGFKTIRQVMSNSTLRAKVRHVMEETGQMLIQKHGFNAQKHNKYIDTILERFANPNLTDQVIRVGRSPFASFRLMIGLFAQRCRPVNSELKFLI